jgi:hypothetical protein
MGMMLGAFNPDFPHFPNAQFPMYGLEDNKKTHKLIRGLRICILGEDCLLVSGGFET